MLTALFAIRWLLVPLLYFTLMVIVWACSRRRLTRYALLMILFVLPIGIGIGTVRELRAVNAAETQFESLCKALDKPAIKTTSRDITSIFLDMRAPQGTTNNAVKHAELAVFSETLTQSLVQGATRYSSVEFQSDRAPLHIIQAEQGTRSITSGDTSSSHTVLWKSINETSQFVSKGTLAIKKATNDDILTEFEVIQLYAPAVAIFVNDRLQFRLLDEQSRTCPDIQNLSRFIKSVARPTLTMSR